MGKKYEGSFLDEIFCNTSNNSVCWLNICNAFCYAKKFAPMLELAAITNNRQWGNVYVKKQDKTADKNTNPFKNSISVNGIFNTHVMGVDGSKTQPPANPNVF